jgi:hypothetical protein
MNNDFPEYFAVALGEKSTVAKYLQVNGWGSPNFRIYEGSHFFKPPLLQN